MFLLGEIVSLKRDFFIFSGECQMYILYTQIKIILLHSTYFFKFLFNTLMKNLFFSGGILSFLREQLLVNFPWITSSKHLIWVKITRSWNLTVFRCSRYQYSTFIFILSILNSVQNIANHPWFCESPKCTAFRYTQCRLTFSFAWLQSHEKYDYYSW